MRSDEVRALGGLAGDAAAGIAGQARDLHAGIAGRVFGALGPPAAPVRLVHDAISAGSYAGARGLAGAIVRAAAGIASLTVSPDAPGLADGPRGRMLAAAVNAAWGDRLSDTGSVLATPLRLTPDRAAARTPRLAVFVHGLGETEDAWRLGSARHRPYGDRLSDRGFTPVYARYNTGLAIARAGAALSAALQELVAGWPVPVTEIALVGHSMGGLVAREACCAGRGTGWSARLRTVVTLGSPHTGAPLARAAQRAERALDWLPESRPFGAPLRARSAGVRDLCEGSAAPFAPGADHFFVAATLTRDPEAPAGRLIGDLLVQRRSAWAQRTRTERLAFSPEHYRHLGGAHHFDLLNHPAIAELLERWIAGVGRAALPSGG